MERRLWFSEGFFQLLPTLQGGDLRDVVFFETGCSHRNILLKINALQKRQQL
jgi:hypothetical protein